MSKASISLSMLDRIKIKNYLFSVSSSISNTVDENEVEDVSNSRLGFSKNIDSETMSSDGDCISFKKNDAR